MCDVMSNLMSQDRCKAILILADWEDAGENKHFAPGHNESILLAPVVDNMYPPVIASKTACGRKESFNNLGDLPGQRMISGKNIVAILLKDHLVCAIAPEYLLLVLW